MIRIVITDDHQIVIDGLKALLATEKTIQIVGEATNGSDLIQNGIQTSPDLILMDIAMPVMDGIEAARILKKEYPAIKILVLTMYAEQKHIKDMLKIGVEGYILKDSGKEEFLTAIHTLMEGETYFDKRVSAVVMNSFQPQKKQQKTYTPLTNREKEIVKLVAEGKSTAEIASIIHLSSLTIETHRKNIYTKLGMNKIAGLVKYALEEGLIE
ncbi:MAG: response regulator transcription factor [Flavobacteriia bacterium]|nr:response regulator transcription factor [Flavobacteriia bacterium]